MKAILFSALSVVCGYVETRSHRVLLFVLRPIRALGEWSWHRAALAQLRASPTRRVDFHL